MILKMMKDDGLEDSNPAKMCVVFSNVVGVEFRRTLLAGKGVLAIGFNKLTENDIVKYTTGDNVSMGYDTFTEFPMEGNAYLMNDDGKTFQMFSPNLHTEPVKPKKEKKQTVKKPDDNVPEHVHMSRFSFETTGFLRENHNHKMGCLLGFDSVDKSIDTKNSPITMDMIHQWNIKSKSILWNHIYNFKGYASNNDNIYYDKPILIDNLEEFNLFLLSTVNHYHAVAVYDRNGDLILWVHGGLVDSCDPSKPALIHTGSRWNVEVNNFE